MNDISALDPSTALLPVISSEIGGGSRDTTEL
jgi:hypothetical protein